MSGTRFPWCWVMEEYKLWNPEQHFLHELARGRAANLPIDRPCSHAHGGGARAVPAWPNREARLQGGPSAPDLSNGTLGFR